MPITLLKYILINQGIDKRVRYDRESDSTERFCAGEIRPEYNTEINFDNSDLFSMNDYGVIRYNIELREQSETDIAAILQYPILQYDRHNDTHRRAGYHTLFDMHAVECINDAIVKYERGESDQIIKFGMSFYNWGESRNGLPFGNKKLKKLIESL